MFRIYLLPMNITYVELSTKVPRSNETHPSSALPSRSILKRKNSIHFVALRSPNAHTLILQPQVSAMACIESLKSGRTVTLRVFVTLADWLGCGNVLVLCWDIVPLSLSRVGTDVSLSLLKKEGAMLRAFKLGKMECCVPLAASVFFRGIPCDVGGGR